MELVDIKCICLVSYNGWWGILVKKMTCVAPGNTKFINFVYLNLVHLKFYFILMYWPINNIQQSPRLNLERNLQNVNFKVLSLSRRHAKLDFSFKSFSLYSSDLYNHYCRPNMY